MPDLVTLFLAIQYALGLYFIYDSISLYRDAGANGKQTFKAEFEYFGLVLGLALLLLAVFSKIL